MNKKILVTFCLLLLTILCLAPQKTAAAEAVKLEDTSLASTVTGQAITATPAAIKSKFKVKRVKNNKVFQYDNVKIKAG